MARPKVSIQHLHGSSQEFVVPWTVPPTDDEIIGRKVGRYWRFQPNGQIDLGRLFVDYFFLPHGSCLEDCFRKTGVWKLASKRRDDCKDHYDQEWQNLLLRFLSRSLIRHLYSIVASCSISWHRYCSEFSMQRERAHWPTRRGGGNAILCFVFWIDTFGRLASFFIFCF